jgi:hypothetical protein
MMNLIGCSKENFFILLELMNYKSKKNKNKKEEFFVYKPKLVKNKRMQKMKKTNEDNPFGKLSEIRFR